MRCASKAVFKAVKRMRTAGDQAHEDSAAGVTSPDTDDKQPATPNVAGARGPPREVSSSAASAAGVISMAVTPK